MSERLAICGGTPVRSERLEHPYRALGDHAFDNVKEAIESGHLNRTGGKWVSLLEERFAEFCGTKFCTASTSGTSAIHLAVGALNPEPGDEIITAPITDMGTIIPILAQNAIPVFADVEIDTGNVDPVSIESLITDRTRAIIPVHLGGNPCDMEAIMDIARKHGLMVFEDCSQAYCATHKGRKIGTIGDIGCFSMQQSKHFTVGDGGLTITNDPDLAEKVKLFADKGWPRYSADGARDYLSFGFCYRMTELQGAVAVSALEIVPSTVERRINNGNKLTELLNGLPGVHPQRVAPESQCVYWTYFVRANPEETGVPASRIAEAVRAEGIPCGYQYIGKPIFMYEAIRRKRVYGTSTFPFSLQSPENVQVFDEGACPNCERFLDELLNIPIHENHTGEDLRDIAKAFEKVIHGIDQLSG